MEYQAIYKCRLCGEIYPKWKYYEEELTEDMDVNKLLFDKHKCSDCEKGIADFQGFKAVEE